MRLSNYIEQYKLPAHHKGSKFGGISENFVIKDRGCDFFFIGRFQTHFRSTGYVNTLVTICFFWKLFLQTGLNYTWWSFVVSSCLYYCLTSHELVEESLCDEVIAMFKPSLSLWKSPVGKRSFSRKV